MILVSYKHHCEVLQIHWRKVVNIGEQLEKVKKSGKSGEKLEKVGKSEEKWEKW